MLFFAIGKPNGVGIKLLLLLDSHPLLDRQHFATSLPVH